MTALSGKYEIGERIGGGGMADVFHAVVRGAEGFQRKVAVKRIKRNISTDKGFAKLFIDEARLAAKLMHPNIVQTIDFDRDETGCFYLVMELIEGVDLRELVASGRVPVSAVVFIIGEVLRALDYAHEMVADGRPITIVHRDISPHNIMLSWQGGVKVVDFGIAKAIEGSLVSRSGSLKGKVAYMSPEQVHGQALDGRSDLFAVGVILHELLTGERLFIDKTEAATLSQVLTKPIANPMGINDQVPPDLDAIVMRLLARDRRHRFERARDALDALSSCSLAGGRGRSDLETVLGERFPGRGPVRVRHLSRSLDHDSMSAPAPQALANSDGWPSPLADTVAATPMAKNPAPLLPKRTVTAMPARSAADAMPMGGAAATTVPRDESKGGGSGSTKLPWIGAALAIVCIAAISIFAIAGGEDEKSSSGIEVIAVDSPDLLDLSVSDAGASQPSTTMADAGDKQGLASDAGVASKGVIDAGQKRAGAGASTDAKMDDRATKSRKKARLTIRVRPWASIVIDGKNYGQTPQTVELEAGRHRIVLRNGGQDRTERFSLTLKAAEVKSIEKDWTGK
jgi:serine/threonine protein kinase